MRPDGPTTVLGRWKTRARIDAIPNCPDVYRVQLGDVRRAGDADPSHAAQVELSLERGVASKAVQVSY